MGTTPDTDQQEISLVEFDCVTFNPYGKPVPARVVGVRFVDTFGQADRRVYYHLTGTLRTKPLTTTTTGKSIEQSLFYSVSKGLQ